MKLTVASWNILNDFSAIAGVDYPLQRERVDLIVEEIIKAKKTSDNFIIFLCELEAENIDYICRKTSLVMVGSTQEYSRLASLVNNKYAVQSGVFLADRDTAKYAVSNRIRTKSRIRDLIVECDVRGVKIIGTHIPQRPITDFFTRRAHVKTILNHDPDIAMGDFNATPLFPTRLRFLKNYNEIHRKNRPPFPDKFYLGRNIKPWWPTMNIDVMFVNKAAQLRTISCNNSLTKASDHPLIWAEIELN